MKHIRKRILSMMMSGVMTASLLPAYLTQLPLPAAAYDPNDPTDLSIPLNFDADAPAAASILSEMRKNQTHSNQVSVFWTNKSNYTDEIQKIREKYDTLPWRKACYWNCNNNESPITLVSDFKTEHQIRTLLESTDEKDMYIALTADDVHEHHARNKWEPIKITTNKVLDLNGHKLEIQYNRNRNNSDTNRCQNFIVDTHNCVAFEIQNGATLTIIDSSAWRGENNGEGTGLIAFTGYMVNPFKYDIKYYTTRDLFHVENGNLVVYGGHFQAGRRKAQADDDVSLDEIKTVIGQAVDLGVKIALYANGIGEASDEYEMLLEATAKKSTAQNTTPTGEDDGTSGEAEVNKRTGKGDGVKNDTLQNNPTKQESRLPSIGEKAGIDPNKTGKDGENKDGKDKDKENKANSKENAKDDSKTSVAKAKSEITKKAADADGIKGMVNDALGVGETIYKWIAGDNDKINGSRITQSIKGTVVKVGANGSFVSYGGTFEGYGQTPNTRNAVIEIVESPYKQMNWDHTKNQGGVAYIYGGNFEACSGANVFNFVRAKADQSALQFTQDRFGKITSKTVTLSDSETTGLEQLFFANQDELIADTTGTVEPIEINTANVQVRGGTFSCTYRPP